MQGRSYLMASIDYGASAEAVLDAAYLYLDAIVNPDYYFN